MKLNVNIPFPGFYYSELSDMEDREIEQIFDIEGNGTGKIPDNFYSLYDCGPVHLQISKLYLEALQDWINKEFNLKVSFEFDIITSPREYNFATDRIFAHISLSDFKKLVKVVNAEYGKEAIADKAMERFTSRDGFISSYSPYIEEWGKDFTKWDYNQLGTVLACFEIPEVYDLMENAQVNSKISNAVYSGFSPEAVKLIPERV